MNDSNVTAKKCHPASTLTGYKKGTVSRVSKNWEHLEDEIEYLVIVTADYCVFLDKEKKIDWEISEDCRKRMKEVVKDGEGAIRNRFAELQAYPCGHLEPQQQQSFYTQLGEALALGFECNAKDSLALFDISEKYIKSRTQETTRRWQLRTCFCAISLIAPLAVLLWFARVRLISIVGETAFLLSFGSCFGAAGALVSILQRAGGTLLDPFASKQLHQLEVSGRMLAGMIAAGAAELAIKIGLFVPFLAEKGTAAYALAALVAGVSERLLPNIVSRVESSSDSVPQSSPKAP